MGELNLITISDICKSVAGVVTELQVVCITCLGQSVAFTVCRRCEDRGWTPTLDLNRVITNIKYPLTIVLRNDMIGWSAEIALDGDIPTGMDKQAHDNPVYAVYEALFEALTDKLGAGKMGEFESRSIRKLSDVKRPRRTRGRGRLIKSVRTVQESVKWLQPGSES